MTLPLRRALATDGMGFLEKVVFGGGGQFARHRQDDISLGSAILEGALFDVHSVFLAKKFLFEKKINVRKPDLLRAES